MESKTWLNKRFQSLVDVMTPKIATTLLDKGSSGKIDLATAENHLLRKEILEVYRAAIRNNLSVEFLSYPTQLGGEKSLLEACASFFNQYFQPHRAVLPEHIVAGPGATACLTSLLCSICEPRDVVLVPGSYWSGFDLHLKLLPDVELLNTGLDDPAQDELGPTMVSALAATAATLKEKQKRLKALILTNPHNPTGRCYSTDVLKSMAEFCQDHNIHLIVDEIYAMSRCREAHINIQGFKSFLSIDLQSIGVDLARVHIIWGTSKDFGSSGIRMGCIVSQDNPSLRLSVGMITTTQISAVTSIATAGLLNSSDLPRLMQLNTVCLTTAYYQVSGWLEAHHMPYIPAVNGVYILARLAPAARTWQDEEYLVKSLNDAGVSVLPGRSFHLREPGWVRITITVPPALLTEALSRMERVLQSKPIITDLQGARGQDITKVADLSVSTEPEVHKTRLKVVKRKLSDEMPQSARKKKLRLSET